MSRDNSLNNKNILSRRQLINTILLCFGFLFSINGYTQSCNILTIRNADELYKLGAFDRVKDLLQPCLLNDGFVDEEESFSALKIMANIYLLWDEYDKAKQAMSKMLVYNPLYSPNKNDENLQFINMFNSLKSTKYFAFDAIVISASKREQRASDAPATIFVVSKEDIDSRGYTNLIELLEDIPSVEIQKNSMNEFKNVAGVRGISGNEKFIIMVDDIRITPATGDPYALGSNFSLINAKRVEVILGPASALYGVDAFSGIINIITQDGDEINGGAVNSSFGQYNSLDNSFVLGTKKNGIDFSVAGHFYQSDDPDYQNLFPEEYSWYNDVYKTTGQVGSSFSDTIFSPSMDYGRNFEMPYSSYYLSSKLNFGNFEIGATRHSDKHISSISVDPRVAIYSASASLETTMQTIYFRHIFTRELRNKRSWSLQSLISMSDFTMDPESNYVNSFTNFNRGYKYQFSKSQKIEEQFEYSFNRKTSLVSGVSYELLSSLPKSSDTTNPVVLNIPTDNQELYYTGSVLSGDTIGIPLDFYYLNYWNFGSFAQIQYGVSDKVEITAGTRYDYNSRYGGSFNPRIGILLKPVEKLKVKLLFGRAFLAPSPWKAYVSFGSFSETVDSNGDPALKADFFHLPNPELNPEKLSSLEGSVTLLPNDHSKFTFGGYFNRIDDLISLQEIDDNILSFHGVPVTIVETSQNQGRAETYGLSFHFYQRLLKTEESTINLYASYDFSGGHIEVSQSDGLLAKRDLPLSAPHTVKAGLDVNHKRLSGSLRFIYRSKSKSVKTLRPETSSHIGAGDNEDKHKAYAVVNLFAKYLIADLNKMNWSGFVKVNNLLNAKYYNVTGATDSFSATPQDPLRISIGVSLSF